MSSRQLLPVFPPGFGRGAFTFILALTLAGGAASGAAAGQDLPLSSLEEVLRSTLERHEAIAISAESVTQAELRKKRILMSLTPDISLQAYSRRVGGTGSAAAGGEGEEEGSGGGIFVLPEGSYHGYNLSLTQPLFTGGRALAAYRGAGEEEGSVRIDEKLTRRDLLVAAAEAYYAVLATMETVRIGEQAVVSAGRHLDLARRRLDLGEGLVTDRLRAEVNLAEMKSDLIRFRNALADARDRARRISGKPLSEDPEMVEFLPEVTGTVEELVEEALAARPEVDRDRHNVRAAEANVKEKKGRFLPSLFAAASYSGIGDEVGEQTTGWEAGLFLEFPIYERASRFYLLKESRSALRQARLSMDGLAKDIALEVSKLHNALRASEGQIGTLRKQVEFAAENLRLAEKRFAVGLADSLELVDTQTANLSSQVNLTGEILRFEVAKLRLYRALGRDIFPDVEQSRAEVRKGSRQARRTTEAGEGTP